MSDEIIWEDPPQTALTQGQRPGRYVKFAQALRDNPGRWAVAPGERTEASAKGFRQNVLRGEVKGFTKGEPWEAAVEGGKVWVRFNPDEDRKAAPEPEQHEDEEPEEDDDAPGKRQLNADVRAWARNNGFNVTDRGRIPREVIEAYHKAGSGRPPVRVVR